jgi:hypothetical protein
MLHVVVRIDVHHNGNLAFLTSRTPAGSPGVGQHNSNQNSCTQIRPNDTPYYNRARRPLTIMQVYTTAIIGYSTARTSTALLHMLRGQLQTLHHTKASATMQ